MKNCTTPAQRLALVASSVLLPLVGGGALQASTLDIIVNYDDPGPGGYSGYHPHFQRYFDAAEAFWESTLVGYRGGNPDGLSLTITATTIAGQSSSAATTSTADMNGFSYATGATINLDANLQSGALPNLIANDGFGLVYYVYTLHEFAHALGFANMWGANGVFDNRPNFMGFPVPAYVGEAAITVFNNEFGRNDAWIPLHPAGGPGTRGAHWPDRNNFGTNPNGVTIGEAYGNPGDTPPSFSDDLMVPFLVRPGKHYWVSDTTVATFYDIGYETNLAAIPEPASALLLIVGSGFLWGRRRR